MKWLIPLKLGASSDPFKQNARMFHELGSSSEEAYMYPVWLPILTVVNSNSHWTRVVRLSHSPTNGIQRYCAVPLLRTGEIFYEHGDFKGLRLLQRALMNVATRTVITRRRPLQSRCGVAWPSMTKSSRVFHQGVTDLGRKSKRRAYTLSGMVRFYFSQKGLKRR